MKYKNIREAFSDYLIIEPVAKEGYEEDIFEEKMLEEQDITGLLPFHVRSINGEKRYYYNISGLKTLSELLGKGSVRTPEIRQIVQSLVEILEGLRDYLLEPGSLLLDYEHIYAEEDYALHLACVPGRKGDLREGLVFLAKTLLDNTENTDYEAVITAHDFYRAALRPDFSLEMLKTLSRQEASFPAEKKVSEKENTDKKIPDKKAPEKKFPEKKSSEEDALEKKAYEKISTDNKTAKAQALKERLKDIKILRKLAPPAVFLAAVAVLYATGLLPMMAAALGMRCRYLIFFSFSLFAAIMLLKARREKKGDLEDEDDYSDVYTFTDLRYEDSLAAEGTCLLEPEWQNSESPRDGEKLILYSEDRDAAPDIIIDDLPAVIGSSPAHARFIIDRSVVSRSHAIIEKDEEQFFLSDLSSTNGTFIGDRRLKPERRYELSEGDILRFADLSYTFNRKKL